MANLIFDTDFFQQNIEILPARHNLFLHYKNPHHPIETYRLVLDLAFLLLKTVVYIQLLKVFGGQIWPKNFRIQS